MAEEATTVKADDQYELGDTEYVIETPDKPAGVAPATPGQTHVIDIGERPRNPDGTFAPFKQSTQVTAAAVANAPPEPPAKERPPGYLVEAARDFGLDDDEIFGMAVPVLHKLVFKLQRNAEAVRQQETRKQHIQDGQVRNPEPAPVVDELDFQVDSEVHPDIAKGLTTLRDRVRKDREENQALREEVRALRTRDEQRELNRAAAIYDAAFAALGEEFAPIVGTGAGREMDNSSAEYKRRITILTEAHADPRVLTPGQIKAKIKAAAEMLYPRPKSTKAGKDAYAETNGGAPRISAEAWNNGGLARPTARKVDDEPPSEAKAVKNLTAKMRETEDVIPDSEELEGFL